MITVSSLLDQKWHARYKAISKLNIRSSIYDVTNKCNLRCKGCFFFSSNEHKAAAEEMDTGKWEAFIDKEMDRGVNLAILIGGEPTLYLDRVEAFYKRLPTFCATNGLIKIPRDRSTELYRLNTTSFRPPKTRLRTAKTIAVLSMGSGGVARCSNGHTTPGERGKS